MRHGRLETKEWVVIIILSFIGFMFFKFSYDHQMDTILNPPKKEPIIIMFQEIQ